MKYHRMSACSRLAKACFDLNPTDTVSPLHVTPNFKEISWHEILCTICGQSYMKRKQPLNCEPLALFRAANMAQIF